MRNRFEDHIKKKLSFLEESKLLIAISGGLDSVVLTQLCHSLGLNFALAHCNFNLRGTESDGDEAFVSESADHLDVELFIQHFDTEVYAKNQKLSIQMAARALRYDWFSQLAHDLSFDYILTAHHADDNLETVLINLTRGTGLTGLMGIPEVNNRLVRPLLPFSREQLEAFARSNQLKWREDSSNASHKYLRNKLRHQVIPILKDLNSDLLENFKTTLENLGDTADIVEESLNAVAKRAIETMDEHQVHFKVSEFKKVNNPKAYLYEMFKAYGFSAWDDVVALLDAQSGKYVLSNTHRLLKDRTHLILTSREDSEATQKTLLVDKNDNKIALPIGILVFEKVEVVGEAHENCIFVDQDKLEFPLSVRPWEQGDYFQPFGMKGKKKLSKFFKDEKLSLVEKEHTWVLCSATDVVWVLGRRADDRFKVTKATKHILKMKVIK